MTGSSPVFDGGYGDDTGDTWRLDMIVSNRLTTCVMFLGLRPVGDVTRLG